MSENDFTQGSIVSKLLKFMIPILGSLILQAMYGAVDILVVGRFGTTAGISGVSTGSSIVNLVTFTVTSLAMGVTVLMGQYLGEKKHDRVGQLVGAAIWLFSILSVVLAACMLLLARPMAILLQAPEEALDLTVLYVRICGGGVFFIIAFNVISSVSRGLGDSNMPLVFVAIACVVNILGDLLFVAVFHWNVAGAALATVLAQAVSVILSVRIIKGRDKPFTMKWEYIRFSGEVVSFVRLGIPIAFQEILTELSFLALCAFINSLGLDASSGYGVANKIVNFVMLVPGALMQSMASFVAQNVGAGKEDRAKRAMLTGIAVGGGIGIGIALLAFFRGGLLSGVFSTDPAVIARAAEYLRGFAPEAVVTSILFSFVGYYNGHSKTLFVMLQGLAQTFIVRLPMSYYMSIRPNASLTMIGLAAPCATVFGIAINLTYFIKLNQSMKSKPSLRS